MTTTYLHLRHVGPQGFRLQVPPACAILTSGATLWRPLAVGGIEAIQQSLLRLQPVSSVP